jgi:hypothetical protein
MLPSIAKHLLYRFVRIGGSRGNSAPAAEKNRHLLPKRARGVRREFDPSRTAGRNPAGRAALNK